MDFWQKTIQRQQKSTEDYDKAWGILENFPFSCRKADGANPFLREIIIPLETRDTLRCMKLKTMKRSLFWLCATKEKKIITNPATVTYFRKAKNILLCGSILTTQQKYFYSVKVLLLRATSG